MRTALRLLLKTHRFELIAIMLACVGLAGGDLFLGSRLTSVALTPDCVYVPAQVSTDPQQPPNFPQACIAQQEAFFALDAHVTEILGFGAALPLLAGIVLGVSVVARELESGTAALAWTMSRSRRRWLLARVIPLAAALSVLLLIPALAADVLEHARQPLVDPGASFNDAGLRGPVFVARGVLAFAIGVVTGSIVGRQLPALIVALFASLVVLVGGELGIGRWEQALGSWRPVVTVGQHSGAATFGEMYLDKATGALVDGSAVFAAAPLVQGGTDSAWIEAHYDLVALVLPGAAYGIVVAGETVVLGGLAVAGLGLAMLVVDRRRPG
jgi:hypothetical protein